MKERYIEGEREKDREREREIVRAQEQPVADVVAAAAACCSQG